MRSRFEAASADAEKEIAAMHAHVEHRALRQAAEPQSTWIVQVRQASQGELIVTRLGPRLLSRLSKRSDVEPKQAESTVQSMTG